MSEFKCIILGLTPPDELPETILRRQAERDAPGAKAALRKRMRIRVWGEEAYATGPLETLPDVAVLVRAMDGDEAARQELFNRSDPIEEGEA